MHRNLSGGQRQRLGLARALYRSADIYLLDDPLSAVDAHVGRHIMDFIISWLKEKTVLMPCHQLHFLHHADYIVALEDSTIREQGTFSDLMSAGGDFARLMQRHAADPEPSGDQEEGEASDGPSPGMLELSEKDMLQVLQGAGEVSGKAQRWDSAEERPSGF